MLGVSVITQVIFFSHVISIVTCVIVQTTTGPVRGKLNNFRGIRYHSYEAIPFAEPPIGKLRFMPPVPVRSWNNVLNATAPGCVCPQVEYIHVRSEMDENCLFLNVYVPMTSSTKPFPVIFYVHGGYYAYGSGNPTQIQGPQLLLERDIIVVTTNYRVGVLGFLSLEIPDASGNAGLKDVLEALRWFNNNVVKFGGDPNSICLVGHGAGASLVHYLLLTEKTTNLVNAAVLLAGSAIDYRALQYDGISNAMKLAHQIGIRSTERECLLKKLKELDAFSIVEAQEYIVRNDPRRAFVLRDFFSPIIEKPSPTAIITRNKLDIIRTEGLVQKIPVLTGYNDQEGLEIFALLKRDPDSVNVLNENFELCVPPNIRYPYGSQERRNLANAIREFYFNNLNITIFNTQNYINLISDTAYSYSIDYWIHLYKQHKPSSNVYYYYLKFDGQLNWFKLFEDITYPGSAHGDGLGYYFVTNVTINRLPHINAMNLEVLNAIIYGDRNLTVNGDPTPFGTSKWIETGNNGEHLEIGNELIRNVNKQPEPERLAFWYKAYDEYYKYEDSSTESLFSMFG